MAQVEAVELLQRLPPFSLLSRTYLERLVTRCTEEYFPSGATVITEGEEGEAFYIILSGKVEAVVTTASGPLVVSTLGTGDFFGEVALLTHNAKRTASVIVSQPLVVLRLNAAHFHELLRQEPSVAKAFWELAELLRLASFLQQLAPFADLSGKALRSFASRLSRRYVRQGEVVLRERDAGVECYLIRHGSFRVSTSGADGVERELSQLETGALFGEAALLSSSPRNASVEALTPGELLVLSGSDLEWLLEQSSQARLHFIDLLRLRDRPKRKEEIEVYERTASDRTIFYLLCDRGRDAYFRLSREGKFLWDRLDGRHTLKDLTLAYFDTFQLFAPFQIAEIVGGLGAAGFVEGRAAAPMLHRQEGGSLRKRVFAWIGRTLTSKYYIRGVDHGVSLLFYSLGKPFTIRALHIAIAVIASFGTIFFFATITPAWLWWKELPLSLALMIGGPVVFLSILIHELGHAFAVKSYGKRVSGIGLGWYWVAPIFFVDTSNMWLSSPQNRIIVALAGPHANFLLGGFSSLFSFFLPSGAASSLFWGLAVASYGSALLNLNPYIKAMDGYHALSEWYEVSGLQEGNNKWKGVAGLVYLMLVALVVLLVNSSRERS